MNWPKKCCIFVLAVMIAAVVLRLPRLQHRPMHGDEAVHAVRFGELLEKNFYRYNPDEYHGPTLNYFTLIPAWLSSIHKFKDLNEFTLRIVPVFFGLLLVLMPLLLLRGLGRPATIIAIVMTAISPAFVFYSRYYIHEMLLVCFTFGAIACGWRYTLSKNIAWALLTGIFLGLMHATKETCIIAFASMLLALLLTLWMQNRQMSISDIVKTIKPMHIIVIIAAAAVVSTLFYSSFFTNPGGILDSFRAYTTYFNRAGQNDLHVHPWYYYFDILTWMEGFEGPTWNEDLIVVMAAVAFIIAMTKKGISTVNFTLLRFLAFYTLIMTVVYSAIPYKTPWCLLGFLHGMILLAAVAVAALIKLSLYWWEKLVVGFLLVFFGLLLPAGQAYLGSYKYYANPSNPYVYAHPTTDVFDITQRIEEVAQAHPDGHNIYIQVICPAGDYWPLPWYLRSFPYVGWWNSVDENIPAAPVIIASPSVEPALMRKLYELPPPGKKNLYVPLFDTYMELRPQVELRGYVRKELWDSYQQSITSKTSR
ncbi:MAG: TIGR03663 family protein [Sedimentisphaerales bacterium]|nr:TIGR03663 family protein [Sedimentisphaerales bacterium]